MEQISVKTSSGSSEIYVGEGCLEMRLPVLVEGQKNFVLTDRNVYSLYSSLFAQYFADVKIFVLEAGEASKSFASLQAVLEEMAAAGMKRNDRLFAIGGGVVGDLGGLCAALYMRGISYVQIPTTLLAQIDSSVGGKTAIDACGLKNIVGAFYQPMEVLVDPTFLHTLPNREWKCGIGELVKYVALQGDLFDTLLANVAGLDDASKIVPLIAKCIRYKAQIVALDERESGVRAALNVGHTTGHAIESASALSHGESVLLGMLFETKIAVEKGVCDADYAKALLRIVRAALALFSQTEGGGALVMAAAKNAEMDKKNRGDGIVMSVPVARGEWASLTLSTQEYQAALAVAVNEE